MDAGMVRRIEDGACAGAAAIFAAAVGFALYRWLEPSMVQLQLSTVVVVAGIVAFLPCWQALRLVGRREPDFPMPQIDLGVAELVLTDANPHHDELLLDDVLAQVAPDSRVVQLFDPAAMPTPGQLKARIDRHLDRGAPDAATPDASQALYDALADLKTELR
jgi:hypothetical protein